MALPLIINNQVVGALDVQSVEPDAFSQEDVNTLSILADQVAIAIQNSRLYEETQEALDQSQILIQQFTQTGWSEFTRTQKLTGIRRSNSKTVLLKETQTVDDLSGDNTLFLPINLRGQKIGTLKVKAVGNHKWVQDEVEIATAIIERAALALENARLIAQSQRRASKEQVIGEASSKISSAINLDNILQTALREMGKILPGAEIHIQVEND
jgi:GAF domain-containing protein